MGKTFQKNLMRYDFALFLHSLQKRVRRIGSSAVVFLNDFGVNEKQGPDEQSDIGIGCILRNLNELVAQLVEQYTFNVWALGSSPSGITKLNSGFFRSFCIMAAFYSI